MAFTHAAAHRKVIQVHPTKIYAPIDSAFMGKTNRLLSVRDIMQTFNISRSSGYRLLHSGHLPLVRIGKAIRVREGDLLDLMQRNGGELPMSSCYSLNEEMTDNG